jgi:hypothetical protein
MNGQPHIPDVITGTHLIRSWVGDIAGKCVGEEEKHLPLPEIEPGLFSS